MRSRHGVCLLVWLASCGSATSAPLPQEREPVEPTAAPAAEPSADTPRLDTPVDAAVDADPELADSPLLGTWRCTGPVQHVAQSYEVSLELEATGRFELSYGDVTPRGGRSIRMQGIWEAREGDGGGLTVLATADTGSESTWRGDMHRQQHRRRSDGPRFASQQERQGVSTHERRWQVLTDGAELRLVLDAEFGTSLGRAVTTGAEPTWRRCEPGRFNR